MQGGIVKWLFRLLYGAGFAVVCYLLFSLFFDTPIEYELKKSTQRLTSRYEELSRSFDTLQNVMDNIDERDRSIYKIIFEAEPYRDSVEDRQTISVEELSQYSNHELGKMFNQRMSSVSQRVIAQRTRMVMQLEQVDASREQINRIPAIQPIDNKDLTLLAASFGQRIHPFYKSKHMHKGVDYAVPIGTAVFATADGVVQQIETRGQSSGLGLTIDHGQYKTFYGNLDRVLARPGARVIRGDIIAFTGNSGLSYAPHLHYEVRLNGQSVDPLPFFFAELDMRRAAKMRRVASIAMQSFD